MSESAPSATGPASAREVKIACRNVWKVYGAEPQRFFANGTPDDPKGVHNAVCSTGHIAAACDVSFDVHVLNQTIMFGLAMLVIAALVGTKGLGQQVYIALGKANTGMGLVAGLGMAMIAMITDRITQAWSARRKAALGL